jgi:4-amino-4-deoxy-L-arabinose transferase-like glycosyltransferase
MVGVGFNIKTLEAYLVLPAFGLLYLLKAPRRFRVRVGQLAVALVVLLVVSFSWLVVVDMTPASQRPYVGSSQNNSEISLALGYNGIQRLGQSTPTTTASTNPGTQPATSLVGQLLIIVIVPFVLFGPILGGQVAWFFPFALLAIFALSRRRRPHVRDDYEQHSRLFWSVWLLTSVAFFSVSHAFILYYMTVLVPAICALFGIGIVVMWQNYRRNNGRSRLLFTALLLTALEQILIIAVNPAWGAGLIPVIALPAALALLGLSVYRRRLSQANPLSSRVLSPVLGLAVAALLLTPAIWSAIPGLQNSVTVVPKAGPNQNAFFPTTFVAPNPTVDARLVRYLEAQQGATKYLVATVSTADADPFILATNKPVMALGGIAGSDPILTPASVQTLVTNNTVRFFFLNSTVAQSGVAAHEWIPSKPFPIANWVDQNCRVVPTSDWASSPQSVIPHDGVTGVMQLFDCAGVR